MKKLFIVVTLLMGINAFAQDFRSVEVQVDLNNIEIGQVLSSVRIYSGESLEDFQFFAACLVGFREAIIGTGAVDYTGKGYKEFYLRDNYSFTPGDDDVVIDSRSAVEAKMNNDIQAYRQELKRCIEVLLMTGTIKTSA